MRDAPLTPNHTNGEAVYDWAPMRPHRFVLLLVVVAAGGGCSMPMTTCDAASCVGCCDATGACQRGDTDGACGQGAGACLACDNTASCIAGQCVRLGAGGGASAGGTAGGGDAGGTAGGGDAGGTAGGGDAGGTAGGSAAGGTAGGSSAGGMAGGSSNGGGSFGGGAAGGTGGAAGGAAILDAGAPLPGPSRNVSPAVRVELNGVIFEGTRLLAVGTRFTTVPNDRDGLFLRLGATSTASFVGGANNDQFYAVANRPGSALAVGLTRTFETAGRLSDSAFLVTIPAVGQPSALVHENVADVGLQPRAIDVTAAGYVVSGLFDDGAQGYVGLVSTTAQAGTTVRFTMPTASYVRVRQVRTAGAVHVVVGDLTVGATMSGFVAAFQSSTLALQYAFVVSQPGASVNLTDVAAAGTAMVAVGQANADGLVVQFDAASGTPVTTARVPQVRLTSIVGPAPVLLTGRRGTTLVTAKLTAGALDGTEFSDLSNPSNISPLPMVRLDGGAVVFGRTFDGGLAQLELNDDLRSGCGGAVSGTPVRVPLLADAGVLVATTSPAVAPITLRVTAVSGLQVTPFGLSPAAACWP